MSELLRLVNTLSTIRAGRKLQFGDAEKPFEMAVTADCAPGYRTIAASSSEELFDGSETDPFATCSIVWVASDRDCMVQLTFDTAGVNGKEVFTLGVKGSGIAGVMGPPLLLADAQAYSNYTEDFAAGTLVYCDRVTVENTDTSNVAKVEYFIGE